ncbi:MAG: nitroreductase family protein [Synergistes sp.]|nr:nitroreductase family protein [Synergistes sp.]
MGKFFELAKKRRSYRKFTDKPVEKELLLSCVEAASFAPSACNSQPWKFTIVVDPEKRKDVAELTQDIGFNQWAEKAQAFIVVSEDAHPNLYPVVAERYGDKRFAEGDVGMATAHLLLQAEDLGLGACVIGTFVDTKVKRLLGISEADTVRAIIAIGYPAETHNPKKRKSVEEISRII